MTFSKWKLVSIAFFGLSLHQARAAVSVTITEITATNEVVISVAGRVNVSGLTPLSGSSPIQQGTGIASYDTGSTVGKITSLRIGGFGLVTEYTGATVAFQEFGQYSDSGIIGFGSEMPLIQFRSTGRVLLSAVYTTGSSNPIIARNWFLEDTSFADLGITAGVVSSASWMNNLDPESITFTTQSVVPEPSFIILLALGGSVVAVRRSRRALGGETKA